MTFKWTEDLSTSVDEIDAQHKEIFRKMDELYSACRLGNGKSEIADVIMFLEDYVTSHFDNEEKYMLEYDYPESASHKSEHMKFIKTIVDLKKQFEKEGPSLSVVIRTNFEIADWFRDHIGRIDKALGIFLKTTAGG